MAPEATPTRPSHLEGVSRAKNLVEIAVSQIIRDECQPREVFSEAELDELTASITARGLLQPIRVRWDVELGKYVIVAGERRWRACRMAGLRAVPCIIHEGVMTESTILQDQIVENMLRQDLRPIEQAKAYRKLMELEGWSARQLARELHIPDASVARALALLDLPEHVQQQVEAGQIAPSVAYQVSQLDRPEDQAELAERVVTEKLTRGEVAEAVKAKKAGRATPAKRSRMEFVGNRVRIVITGEAVAAEDHEAIVAALRDALERFSDETRGSAREQAA
jgi:ParB family chromosome partitioning protein